jgi:hypothetical protein
MPKHESWLHTGGTNDTKALKLTVIKYVCAWIMVQFLFHLDYLDVQICEEKPIKGEIRYINNAPSPGVNDTQRWLQFFRRAHL